MELFASTVGILQTGGPYAIVVFLGWAYFKKDSQLTSLYRELITLVESQATSATKMESALLSLKDVINTIAQRSQ